MAASPGRKWVPPCLLRRTSPARGSARSRLPATQWWSRATSESFARLTAAAASRPCRCWGAPSSPPPTPCPDACPVTDLVTDPANDMIMYAAIGNPFGSVANGFYRSVDGGATWFRFGYPPDPAFSFPTDNVGRIALAVAPSAPRTLYAAVARPIRTGDPLSGTLRGVFKSFNGGDAWTPRPATGALCAINDQQGP